MSDEIVILSPEDSALDAFCMAHRTDLVTLQRAIEKNEGKLGKCELERRLGRMRKALLAKNTDAAEGWLYALVDGIKAVDVWIEKTSKKLVQEKALKAAQPSGTKALKEKSEHRLNQLRQDIDAYITGNQLALKRGATTCRNALRSRGLMHGYSDTYVLQKVKLAFAEHRRRSEEITKPS